MTNHKPIGPASEGQEPSHNGTHPARDHDVDRGAQAVGKSKFDLGVNNGWLPSEDIPWGYGENRVTVMARDPDWLYVYWEITDDAIDEARHRLGRGAHDAWCCLRIYDTTGRVFDGANALSYFDIAIDRTSRDWFVHVGKPRSSCHVEIGVKSRHGDFQPVARSGRTDFPRKRPAQDVSVEWLTVEDAAPNAKPLPVTTPYISRFDGPVPDIATNVQPPPPQTHQRHIVPYRVIVDQHVEHRETWQRTWTERRTFAWSTRVSHRFEGAYHRWSIPWVSDSWRTEWQGEDRAFDWIRPLHSLTWTHAGAPETWEMAPYPGDSAAPGRVLVRFVGESHVLQHDSRFERVMTGPWEVVIHGLSFGAPHRRVLGTWLLHRTEPIMPVAARWELTAERVWHDGFVREHVMLGASESQVTVERGASELWVLGGSEQLWLGASEAMGGSEQLWLGASELRAAGASELIAGWEVAWLGASEMTLEMTSALLARGASERSAFGASEVFALGASERIWLGAEEVFVQASSELLGVQELVGASEQVGQVSWVKLGELIGASELLGGSERWGGSEQLLALTGASENRPRPEYPDILLGGASEQAPGITGPRQDQRHLDSAVLDGGPWTAAGASEDAASATYPETLDGDDGDDGDDSDDASGKEGG